MRVGWLGEPVPARLLESCKRLSTEYRGEGSGGTGFGQVRV